MRKVRKATRRNYRFGGKYANVFDRLEWLADNVKDEADGLAYWAGHGRPQAHEQAELLRLQLETVFRRHLLRIGEPRDRATEIVADIRAMEGVFPIVWYK